MKRYLVIIAILCSNYLWAQWTHIGPFSGSTSGFNPEQLDCIVVDPTNTNNLYTSATNGGVWMSNNDGAQWNPLDPGNTMYYGGASALAVDPNSGNVYIACSSEYRSVNNTENVQSTYSLYMVKNPFGTQIWTSISLPTSCYVYNIQFHPTISGLMYLCTSAGLYVSTNYGTLWTLAYSTPTYNVAFVPDGSTTYCFATGSSIFLESTNGTTFTPNATIAGDISGGGPPTMSNICAGNLTLSTKYMYVEETSPSNGFDVYQLTENAGTITCASSPLMHFIDYYPTLPDYDPGRLALGYIQSKNLLIFGGVNIYLYDAAANNFPSIYEYHSDNHYVLDVPGPGGSTDKVFIANDGGILSCNYSGYTNSSGLSFSLSSTGLDVAQITGFSGTQDENNVYVLGDQDAENGWEYNATGNAAYSTQGSTEPWGGIINRNNSNQMIMNYSTYVLDYQYNNNSLIFGSTWHLVPEAPYLVTTGTVTTTSYTPIYNPNPTPPFEAETSGFCGFIHSEADQWNVNQFYQDPSPIRPNKIYYTTSTLNQWDPVNNVFAAKLWPAGTLSSGSSEGPGFIDWAPASIISMAISPKNHNATYLLTCNRDFSGDQCFPHLIKFIGNTIGNDIDNCWLGQNDGPTDWQVINPPFASIYTYSFGTGDTGIDQICLDAVVVSNWNPNKVWVGGYGVNFPAIKVLQYDAGNTTTPWTDYSTGIPIGEYVKSMEMEIGSNDGIYLGTNRAVYYRNATMSSWQLYNTGATMPSVQINQLQINYYQNNLRAGTYGRGLWLSGLNCPAATYTVLANTTDSEFDEESQYITSTAQVTASTNSPTDGAPSAVVYRGGTYIKLRPNSGSNPGFKATKTSNFCAFIHPCTSSYTYDPNSPNSVKINTEGDKENSSTSTMVQAINSIEGPHVTVYPNPNKGVFTAQLPEDDMSDIHIYSLLGSEVYTGTQLSNQVQIDLSTQPSGIYFYRVTDSESGKLIGSGKVVIQK